MSEDNTIEAQAVLSETHRLIEEFIGLNPISVRKIFEEARAEAEKQPSPVIIFLDEVDLKE